VPETPTTISLLDAATTLVAHEEKPCAPIEALAG